MQHMYNNKGRVKIYETCFFYLLEAYNDKCNTVNNKLQALWKNNLKRLVRNNLLIKIT